jgi:hypothetical protein
MGDGPSHGPLAVVRVVMGTDTSANSAAAARKRTAWAATSDGSASPSSIAWHKATKAPSKRPTKALRRVESKVGGPEAGRAAADSPGNSVKGGSAAGGSTHLATSTSRSTPQAKAGGAASCPVKVSRSAMKSLDEVTPTGARMASHLRRRRRRDHTGLPGRPLGVERHERHISRCRLHRAAEHDAWARRPPGRRVQAERHHRSGLRVHQDASDPRRPGDEQPLPVRAVAQPAEVPRPFLGVSRQPPALPGSKVVLPEPEFFTLSETPPFHPSRPPAVRRNRAGRWLKERWQRHRRGAATGHLWLKARDGQHLLPGGLLVRFHRIVDLDVVAACWRPEEGGRGPTKVHAGAVGGVGDVQLVVVRPGE